MRNRKDRPTGEDRAFSRGPEEVDVGRDPAVEQHDVVVGEQQEIAARAADAGVLGSAQPDHRLLHPADPRVCLRALAHDLGGVVLGGVVDHHDFEPSIGRLLHE